MTFQFQYGAIEGYDFDVRKKTQYNFNSSMVRLKAWKTVLGWVFIANFNSSMVRLKAVHGEFAHTLKFISIPVWCDWRMKEAGLNPNLV